MKTTKEEILKDYESIAAYLRLSPDWMTEDIFKMMQKFHEANSIQVDWDAEYDKCPASEYGDNVSYIPLKWLKERFPSMPQPAIDWDAEKENCINYRRKFGVPNALTIIETFDYLKSKYPMPQQMYSEEQREQVINKYLIKIEKSTNNAQMAYIIGDLIDEILKNKKP